MPRTSVIITTHNRPHLLPRAVQSAQAAGDDVEIVIVDDASTDHTAQVCQSFEGINYVRANRNQGVAGARNLGLVASRGEYVTFLDDDDSRLPGSIDRQLELLEREPQAAMIYGRAIVGDKDGQPTDASYPQECPHGDVFWNLLAKNFVPCGSAIFRRDCLTRVGLLDAKVAGIDDWDLWVRLSENFPIAVYDSPTIIWRRPTPNSGQGSSEYARMLQLSVQQFRKVWMNLPRALNAPSVERSSARKRFSENITIQLIWESARAAAHGQLREPVRSLSIIPQLHLGTFIRVLGRHARKTRTAWSSGELFERGT